MTTSEPEEQTLWLYKADKCAKFNPSCFICDISCTSEFLLHFIWHILWTLSCLPMWYDIFYNLPSFIHCSYCSSCKWSCTVIMALLTQWTS